MIAVWIPVTVVWTSLATVAIETFITELSSVIRNWPDASVIKISPAPLALRFAVLGTGVNLANGGNDRLYPLARDGICR